jgi:hypothetical protein
MDPAVIQSDVRPNLIRQSPLKSYSHFRLNGGFDINIQYKYPAGIRSPLLTLSRLFRDSRPDMREERFEFKLSQVGI